MVHWGLVLGIVAAIAWAWIRRQRPLPGLRLRQVLLAAFAGVLALRFALQIARGVPEGPAAGFALAGAVAAALGLVALFARVSIVEPFHPANRVYRLVMLVAGVLFLVFRVRAGASLCLALGLARFPWTRSLRTGERFLASVLSLAAFLAAAWRWPVANLATELREPDSVVRLARTVTLVYSLFATFAAFKAFTRDPTLGIRRVSRRLALSHVLVVGVPLAIVVLLWVSSTYLGVNADRALIAARAVDREGTRLAESMRVALRSGADADAAAHAVAAARQSRWPHLRLFAVRDSAVLLAAGAPLPDGATGSPLAGWCDSLRLAPRGPRPIPDHGIVQLRARRWLGAAAADSGRDRWLVALEPVSEALDSTISPLVGGTVSMRDLASRRFDVDSLRTLRDSLRAARAVARRRREAEEDSVALRRARAIAGRFGVPPERLHSAPRGAPIVVQSGRDTVMQFDNGEIGLTGQAIVRGVTFDGREWSSDEFALTAHASLAATLTGLFENIRENPLRGIPLAVLLGLGIVLVPLAWTDMRMVRGMGGSITRGIGALREGALAFGAGRLAHRIPIEGDDDLWDTARQFNQMAEGLERARELEKERDRLEAELDLARRIQARLLPVGPPHVPGLDVAGVSESAREVGGDYYDHLELGDGRVLLVVADVSGKGVPAALLMSAFRASLISQDVAHTEPATLAARLNDFLVKSVEPGRFVTAFVGFLDGGSGRFVYVNAGHNPPVVVRAGGGVQMLAEGGLILGILPGSQFTSGETQLAPGDLVALYTDGVTEGADATLEQWGEERLVASLQRLPTEAAAAIATRIVREVRAFEGESGPADDITVLIARRMAAT